MPGYIDSEATQLLNQAPDFGAIRRNFLRNLGAASDDGCILHEKTHDAAQTNVGGLRMGVAARLRGREGLRLALGAGPRRASCLYFLDDRIMRSGVSARQHCTTSRQELLTAKCAKDSRRSLRKSETTQERALLDLDGGDAERRERDAHGCAADRHLSCRYGLHRILSLGGSCGHLIDRRGAGE
jgi:hypothetical protein